MIGQGAAMQINAASLLVAAQQQQPVRQAAPQPKSFAPLDFKQPVQAPAQTDRPQRPGTHLDIKV
jgi:hypothetical protein